MNDTAAASEQRCPTREQLHGQACIDCGSTNGPLLPAGYTYTRSSDGGRLGWPVVACPTHLGN